MLQCRRLPVSGGTADGRRPAGRSVGAQGDRIEVLRIVNDDWLFGVCRGASGLLPANYVQDVGE